MSSETLFFVLVTLDVLFVLACFKLGKEFLFVAVVSNIMFTNMVSSKLVIVFGLGSTVANVFYAAIFLATDILNEYYGRNVARKAVWMGFAALVPIIIFAPFVKEFIPLPVSQKASDAVTILFSLTPRIATASLAAYLAANLFDVWLFQRIRERFPHRRWLWLRKNGSTFASQFIDQVVYCTLAFALVVPSGVLFQILVSGYLIKIFVATLETPLVYAVKWIGLPKDVVGYEERTSAQGPDRDA
jgi:queuosine precursor transporter